MLFFVGVFFVCLFVCSFVFVVVFHGAPCWSSTHTEERLGAGKNRIVSSLRVFTPFHSALRDCVVLFFFFFFFFSFLGLKEELLTLVISQR